jgi:hypothetical protein
MAKKFGGFTPEQQQTLLSKLGYNGPAQQDDINKYMMASPKAASMMGRYAEMARKRVEGDATVGFAAGGYTTDGDKKWNIVLRDGTYYIRRSDGTPGTFSAKDSAQLSQLQKSLGFSSSAIAAADDSPVPADSPLPILQNVNPTPPTEVNPTPPNDQDGVSEAQSNLDAAKQEEADAIDSLNQLTQQLSQLPADDPNRQNVEIAITEAQASLARAKANKQTAVAIYEAGMSSTTELRDTALTSPEDLVTTAGVQTFTDAEKAAGTIATGSGTAGTESQAGVTDAFAAADVVTPVTKDAATYDATTAQQGVQGALEGMTAAQGAVSQGVTAQQGELSDKAVADAIGMDEDYIQQVKAGTLNVTPEQLASAALATNIPEAEIATFLGTTPQAVAATLEGPTPEVTAQTDYMLGKLGVKTGSVKGNEIIEAQGADLQAEQANAEQTLREAEANFAAGEITQEQLASAQTSYEDITTKIAQGKVQANEIAGAIGGDATAEQAKAQQTNYFSDVQGATTTVGAGETISAQDKYKLPATKVAEMNATEVQDAAKAGSVITSDAAISGYQSTLTAAQGTVGANELASAKDIIATEKAVSAIAATMDTLNQQSVMVAAQGTFSQNALAKAAQGTVSTQSTVQGQMASLMEQFNNGTPAWAAGAMRAANAAMNARGLGGSSMAAAAIVQASMEAAIPIATQDAETFAAMGMANLDNRQQVSLANAAAQQGLLLQNLNNMQQAALQNSTNAFALQTQSLSNTQAVVIANAQLKSSFQEKTLDIKTQTSLSNAARYAEMNDINLNNSQQARLQKSSENLQVDMANLSNRQQTALSNLQVQAAIAGQELSNEQQMAVLESTQAFDAAQFDASNFQQAFMQDAQSRAALEGRAMDIRQQTQIFNASRIAEVNNLNLNNIQQANLQKSAENLQIDIANLSNRQQTDLANAQLRASLQDKVLSNAQQVELVNAARYAEVNNINLSNAQQAFVQDSIIKSTMEGKVLDNKQQVSLFNAARQADLLDINLANEQQALVLQSTQNFDADIANLSNRQQASLANAQLRAALQGKVLDNKQQAEILNAERYAEVNNINLNNENQALVQSMCLMLPCRVRCLTINNRLQSLM